MHYEDDPGSTVDITAQSGTDEEFFPADANQTLHYRMTVVDEAGFPTRELVADQPTLMHAEISEIPPLGTGFVLQNTITFSDRSTQEPVVVLRGGSVGKVIEPVPLDLELAVNRGVAADDVVDLRVSVRGYNSRLAAESTLLWWAVAAHGVERDGERPLISRVTPEPLQIRGVRAGGGPGMVVVHAFQFGAPEAELRESHVVHRV
jgi:hypothetical protein